MTASTHRLASVLCATAGLVIVFAVLLAAAEGTSHPSESPLSRESVNPNR